MRNEQMREGVLSAHSSFTKPVLTCKEMRHRCAWCGVPGDGFKTCSSCCKMRYCCREHQRLAWKCGHKLSCGQPIPTEQQLIRALPSYIITCLQDFGPGLKAVALMCFKALKVQQTCARKAEAVRMLKETKAMAVVCVMEAHSTDP
jgi:hypothetical protein